MQPRVPYVDLSAMARVEAHRKNIYRPPYYVHKWWARRVGSIFRGIALDMLLPDGEDVMSAYYCRHNFSDIVVLDPFMGGGTTVGEALRLGCKVVGSDLNPVAWYLVTQAMRSASVPKLVEAFQGVAHTAAEPISEMYLTTCAECGGAATSQYVSWVKQVPCGNCGLAVDLRRNQVIMADMATKGAGLVECAACGHPWWVPAVRDEVECPVCAHRAIPAERRTKSTHYSCERCHHEDRILNAVRSSDMPPVHRMRALTVWCESCGKHHQKPTAYDIGKYDAISQDVARRFDHLQVPREPIRAGFNTNQMLKYGYRYWYQMFNARQLKGLEALFKAIRKIEDTSSRELLTLLASASLEFNSMFCGAKGLGTGAIRHVFAHHAFIPVKEPLEANIWGVHRSSGGYATLFKERLLRGRRWAEAPNERRFTGKNAEKVAIPNEQLAGRPAECFDELLDDDADMLLLNQSSEVLDQIPNGSVDVVITDPPFADNVMYSELSDYFYVWLRQALKDEYPNFAPPAVDDRREAVHNPGRGRDGEFYENVLGSVFAEARRKLKRGGRMAFTFHHSGDSAWRQIEAALIFAGFVVERWWPVFAEMESGVPLHGKENNGHLDIVFVCAKADDAATIAKQESVEQMGVRLAKRVNLVPADHRALLEAKKVQQGTWQQASQAKVA